MTRGEFEGQLSDLRAEVICTISKQFQARMIDFDVAAFLEESDVNLNQVLREAFFHGAEIFPIDH